MVDLLIVHLHLPSALFNQVILEEIFYGEFRTLSYLHSCYNPFSFIKQIIQGLSLKVHQIVRYRL